MINIPFQPGDKAWTILNNKIVQEKIRSICITLHGIIIRFSVVFANDNFDILDKNADKNIYEVFTTKEALINSLK